MAAYRDANATVSAHGAVAITPSDSSANNFPVCRAIYVGTTGNIVAIMADGQTVTFNAVPVGIFPIQVVRINSTNTTASNLIALY